MSITQAYAQINPKERAISPASITAVLAALGYGASGPAQQQLMQFYGFNNREQFLSLLQGVTQMMKGEDIKGGNALFFDSKYSVVKPEYYQAVSPYIALAQFSVDNPVQSHQEINGWIERNSGLPNVIPMDVFNDPNLRMIVANAMWFKDDWENQFQKSNTQVSNFTRQNSQIVKVPMMYQKKTMEWYDANAITAIRMNFKHGAHAEFIMGIPGNTAISGTVQYQHGEVELYLPRFEAEQEINLMSLFQAAGLQGLFVDGFGYIDLKNQLVVSAGGQKLLARFDEQGAEVKVATYVGLMLPTIAMPRQNKIIRFDRSFHYRIIKNNLSIIEGWYDGERIEQLGQTSSSQLPHTGGFQLPTVGGGF